MRTCLVVAAVVIGLTGCAEHISLEAPTGWSTDDRGRWWTAETDTALAFRPMDSFDDMDVNVDLLYAGLTTLRSATDVQGNRTVRYVQQRLLPLFRNEPEVVDSLFRRYVAPDLHGAGLAGDPTASLDAHVREAYRTISRHFRDARPLLSLGSDIPVPVPDSLRDAAAGELVNYQIYVNTDGEPVALMQLEGVHPVIDRIALKAVTAMRWQPAYLLDGGASDPIPSWVRLGVRFPGPRSN